MVQITLRPDSVQDADDGLLAANKPPGIPVHGSQILEDAPETLLARVRQKTGRMAHLVHRLDRPVSGVVLFTTNRDLLTALGRQFESREVTKVYLAVARGWTESAATICYPLMPPRDERKTGSAARDALTRYERIAQVEIPYAVHPYPAARYSLLGLYPQTGRRHQLRMHMKHIHHHLIGDTTYGRGEHNRLFREKFDCHRLLLHAWSLEFLHPVDGRSRRIEATLDDDFSRIIDVFGWRGALESWAAGLRTGGAPGETAS